MTAIHQSAVQVAVHIAVYL